MILVNLFLLFISCSFIGWILECILLFYEEKRFINRGFLIGPMCPLYGSVAVLIIVIFNESSKSLGIIISFILITLLCAVVEYSTSYILEKIFNTRWWDYSKEKYNINGRINLVTLACFGIMGLILIYIFYPLFNKAFKLIPNSLLIALTIILGIIFIIDSIISFVVAFEFKEKTMKIAKNLKNIDSTEALFKLKEKILKDKPSFRRLINAFPTIKFDILNKIKKRIPRK